MEDHRNILYILHKGYEYLNTNHNMPKAHEYFSKAKEVIDTVYGKNSRLSCFVNVFDYLWEDYHGDYRQAALKLADAAELLESFCEQDVIDEFTGFIYENKENLLPGLAADTLQILMKIDFEFSPGDIMWQAVLSGMDKEELINRTFIDKLGLPRRFHYLIQHMCKETQQPPSKELLSDAIEIFNFMQDTKNIDWDTSSRDEKLEAAKKMHRFIKNNLTQFGDYLGAGASIYAEGKKKDLEKLILRGMIDLEETDFAENLLDRLKQQDFDNVSSQLENLCLECYLENEKKEKEKAAKILDEILQKVESIVIQIFVMTSEEKKIEFLNGMEPILKQAVNLCNEVRGAEAAFELVLRIHTLNFERKGIAGGSSIYLKAAQEIAELDEREKNGEDVSLEREKYQQFFEQESDGVFSAKSGQICARLKNGQALLEFTVLGDIRGRETYCVFVVTTEGVSIVKLGERKEIDPSIEGILKYISEYEASKHSKYPIRRLREYYDIYEKVLQPIGSILSRNVQGLFIAGAGRFLEIPFGMLPCFHWYDEYMEDKYRICYLNSGRELLSDAKTERQYTAVVVGDPDFAGKFPPLPSSLREAVAVADILGVTPFTGDAAVSDCLKMNAGIFHISTHSFEEDDLEENTDPMERTGLVFAGGQKITAREIAKSDLTYTDLVVLSVCGVKQDGGIYSGLGGGIRKAIMSAGARHLILNLWKTDDNAAEILMKCFYHYYVRESLEIEESIRKAKNYLRTSTLEEIRKGIFYDKEMENVFIAMSEEEVPYAHPYYWAGFIINGA